MIVSRHVAIGFIADYPYRHMPANNLNSNLIGKLFITSFRSDMNLYNHILQYYVTTLLLLFGIKQSLTEFDDLKLRNGGWRWEHFLVLDYH